MSSELFRELGTGFEASCLRQPLLKMIRIKSQGPFNDPPGTGFREMEMAGPESSPSTSRVRPFSTR